MPSAIDLGLEFGIAPDKVTALLERFNIELDAPAFVPDANFNRVANDLRRGNITALTVSYWFDCMVNGGPAGEQKAGALEALTPDKGQALSVAFVGMDHITIKQDHLPGAKLWLDRAAGIKPDPAALEKLAAWTKGVLGHARGDTGHLYLSVRLMLSLPENERADYTKAIQTTLNRLKHYGYLDGWHRIETGANGKRKTIYFNGENHIDL